MNHLLGWLLIVIGAVVILVGAAAFVDPIGSKTADDADPFGHPLSRSGSAIVAGVGVAICIVGRRVGRN